MPVCCPPVEDETILSPGMGRGREAEDLQAQTLLQAELDSPDVDHDNQRVVALRTAIRGLATRQRKPVTEVTKLHLKDKDSGDAQPPSELA